jgi:acyl-CoA hydrolase
VAIDKDGGRVPVPPVKADSEAEREVVREAEARRTQRLARQKESQSWLKVMKPLAGG